MPIPSTIKVTKQIKIHEATVSLWENEIVHVYYNDNTVLDIDLQLKMAAIFNEITQYKKSHFIFEAGEDVTITKEARDNALKLEDSTPILASAVIAQNLAYRIIANFFLKVQKPKGQYRVVANFNDAIEWINKLKNTNNK